MRGVWRRKIWWAGAVTVVRDDPGLIALYWPAGTPEKAPERRLTPRDLLSTEQLALVDRRWTDTDVLMLAPPGTAHAVYAMWEQGQTSLRCWYIDLQEPLRRTPVGFDTMDHLLDIVVSPDRSEWRWKDEDEFSEAVAIGVFSTEEARAIRAEGERAITRFQAGEPPFGDGWEKWSPPAEWGIPDLPAGWNDLESSGKLAQTHVSGVSFAPGDGG
jgi:hypothetical protein